MEDEVVRLKAQIEVEVDRVRDAVKDKKILTNRLNRAMEFINSRTCECCKSEAAQYSSEIPLIL